MIAQLHPRSTEHLMSNIHLHNTIQHADVILVLENGDIVEQGSYNDLLKQQGAFTQLMARQLI